MRTLLESLDVKKATGGDDIPARVLKISAKEMALLLCTLFNSCIKKGTWPSDWKRGDWTLAFKKGDRQAQENYRPITVLSCLNKVFEQLLCNQITSKFDYYLGDCLTAYRRHHSCESSIIGLVPEDWKRAKDNQLLSVSSQRSCRKRLTVCIHHLYYAS